MTATSATPPRWDVIIIGGGPAGSTAATTLAKAGRKVLLLEKERFPRFHVGESLLPYNQRIFDQLDLTDYHLYHATRADLLRRLGREGEARAAYDEAIARTENAAERAFLTRRRTA